VCEYEESERVFRGKRLLSIKDLICLFFISFVSVCQSALVLEKASSLFLTKKEKRRAPLPKTQKLWASYDYHAATMVVVIVSVLRTVIGKMMTRNKD